MFMRLVLVQVCRAPSFARERGSVLIDRGALNNHEQIMKFIRSNKRQLREMFSRAQIESNRDPEMREWLLARRAMKPDGSLDWRRIYEMERLARRFWANGSQGS
jgi:hypothetical protein